MMAWGQRQYDEETLACAGSVIKWWPDGVRGRDDKLGSAPQDRRILSDTLKNIVICEQRSFFAKTKIVAVSKWNYCRLSTETQTMERICVRWEKKNITAWGKMS